MGRGKHRADGSAQRRPRPETETSDFVAMLIRQLHAFGARIGDDPVALVHMRELEATLQQQINRGIFLANRRGQYSQNHMARILGVTRQLIAHRIKLGEQVHAAEVQRLEGGAPLISLREVRGRRARLAAAADVPDLTGSERERALRVVGE